MKSILGGILAMVLIAAIAGVILHSADISSSTAYTSDTGSVRLD